MKKRIFQIGLLFLFKASFGQEILAIQTAMYSNRFCFQELYLCSDSSELIAYKHSQKYSNRLRLTLLNRQKYLLVEDTVLVLWSNFFKSKNEHIDPGDFPRPFSQIYYIEIFDCKLRRSIITQAFGKDKRRIIEFFNQVLSLINVPKTKSQIEVVNSIQAIMKKIND